MHASHSATRIPVISGTTYVAMPAGTSAPLKPLIHDLKTHACR